MGTERVVDNRVFLLGLDELYRGAIKGHERGELLRCARRIAKALHVGPANVPVEGYYTEDAQLTEYFLLVRALQKVHESARPSVESLSEFKRLLDVVSAPLYGNPQYVDMLLPVGRDAMALAMTRTLVDEWTVASLTAAAYDAALETDEISLVGLAARAKDSLVLAAVRESVVLYAELIAGMAWDTEKPKYVWKVDEDLAEHARRFIDTFNQLFHEKLPLPEPRQAERFWAAYRDNEVLGRCVRIGFDDRPPVRHYHWAICESPKGELVVHEFWNSQVWTTARYRSALRGGRCLEL